ncbi:MAG: 50S ribosomal protein L22, partial [Anaerolineae bacterium]|nr:50S ribosomal protein L22 [Phycisphaerae bacterium]
MAYTAKHRFARITARKARLVLDLVRGRDVDDALAMLRFSKKRASDMVAKV